MTEYQVCAENCCGTENADFYDAMESRLMQMTFWAHKEVLFEKIKQKIKEEEGGKLDKIADLLVDASNSKWKGRQEADKKREELKEKLKDAFGD